MRGSGGTALRLPLAPAAWPKRVGEWRDGEDALAGAGFDLLLAHAPQKADIVLLHGLVVAALAELADLAVVVQDQSGRRTRNWPSP